jgi:hypothetical protein
MRPAPVTDGGEHSWTRVLDGRSWSHWPGFVRSSTGTPILHQRSAKWGSGRRNGSGAFLGNSKSERHLSADLKSDRQQGSGPRSGPKWIIAAKDRAWTTLDLCSDNSENDFPIYRPLLQAGYAARGNSEILGLSILGVHHWPAAGPTDPGSCGPKREPPSIQEAFVQQR